MSRAFVKEGAPEDRPVIPPRAPLPPGVPNYVTPDGLAALRAEKADLEAQRAALGTGADTARQREVIAGRLKALVERIASAQEVDPSRMSPSVVRFGAFVEAEGEDGTRRTVQIVGVDEAGNGEGRVAFTAPIARALLGKSVGDTAVLQTPRGEERLVVASISYAGVE